MENNEKENIDKENDFETIKLQKYIASAGFASRRKAEEYIKEGKVFVNGKKASIGDRVSLDDEITMFGKVLRKEEKEYYLLNKPLGVVTTAKEQFDRLKITDLIKTKSRIVPAGRLDMYTTGAIILTNDGELINNLTHPSKEIKKEYYVTLTSIVSEEQLEKLRKGVLIDNKITSNADVRIMNVDQNKKESKIAIRIHEGRNRQVRKMCESVGLAIKALHRSEFAGLKVNNLKPGNYRKLTKKEIKYLKSLA